MSRDLSPPHKMFSTNQKADAEYGSVIGRPTLNSDHGGIFLADRSHDKFDILQ